MAATAARIDPPQRRVLIVDDDHAVCDLVTEMLQLYGYEIDCVATDREAMHRMASGDPPDVVILDVNLGPGVTGFDLGRYARSLRPDFPVVYVSGQSSRASFKANGVPGSVFVEKPFTADELVDAVEIALADD